MTREENTDLPDGPKESRLAAESDGGDVVAFETGHDVMAILHSTPENVLRAHAMQQFSLPQKDGKFDLKGSVADLLLFILRWHADRYPSPPEPTTAIHIVIYNDPAWFAMLMDAYLKARILWKREDVASLSTCWKQQHSLSHGERPPAPALPLFDIPDRAHPEPAEAA